LLLRGLKETKIDVQSRQALPLSSPLEVKSSIEGLHDLCKPFFLKPNLSLRIPSLIHHLHQNHLTYNKNNSTLIRNLTMLSLLQPQVLKEGKIEFFLFISNFLCNQNQIAIFLFEKLFHF
jgi:hypothetical protein